VTLPYALEIASKGVEAAVRQNPALAPGVNTWNGACTNEGVAVATGVPFTALATTLG
jgi:alanine dehydrogenase